MSNEEKVFEQYKDIWVSEIPPYIYKSAFEYVLQEDNTLTEPLYTQEGKIWKSY